MSVKYTVFYEPTSLSIIRHLDGETKSYHLKSLESHLIIEESKVFIKEFTASSFLHSPEFDHFICPDHCVTLPVSLFDPSFLNEYFERVHGKLEPLYLLQYSSIHHQKAIHIFKVPIWTKSLLESTFSNTTLPSIFEHLLQSMELYAQRKVVLSLLVSNNSAFIVLKKNGELHFIDAISIESIEDILYHMLNILTKNNIKEELGVILIQSINDSFPLHSISSLLGQISSFNSFEIILKTNQKK